MNQFNQKMPYPHHLLPPMLIDFAQQVIAATQSSYEMVVPVMLAGMSAAVQGVADVETPYGEVMPTSLFACVVAKSGDRKSSVLKKVMRGFEDFERGRFAEGLNPSSDAFKSHQFLIEEATSKGVTDIFKNGGHSLFYSMDEGAILRKNLDLPSLCKRFDGSAINELSRSKGATLLHDRRVALCMLIQDASFDRWVGKKSDLLVESGFMPRMLISQANTGPSLCILGERLSPEELDKHAFHERVRSLMMEYAGSLGTPEIFRKKISFSPSAKALWTHSQNETEKLISFNSNWGEMRSFIRRSGEIVCRLAAVLQHFTDPYQDIQDWNVRAATDIVAWHCEEANRIFGNDREMMKFQAEVNNLYFFILGRMQRSGKWFITRSEILRCGPVSMRKAEALDDAIDNLISLGRIVSFSYKRRNYFQITNPTNNFHLS